MEANKIKTSTVIIAIAVVVVVEFFVRLAISQNLVTHFTGLGLARLAEIILLLIIVKNRQHSMASIGLTSSHMANGFISGLIWAVSFGATVGSVLLIFYLVGIKISGLFRMQLPSDSNRLVNFLLVGVLIGPIAEEIFFRGILYGFFRKWGVPTAILLSTLLFVLSHTQTSGSIIPVTQLIGGILFAISYEVEKNLLVPITIHCLGNLAIFTLALLT
jgi:membrane protease YdiL (CAAX protease family)